MSAWIPPAVTIARSIEIYKRALPGDLPEPANIYQSTMAVRRVRDALSGVDPYDLTHDEAEAIRRVAKEMGWEK